jgi:hypothetical protein
MTLRPMDTFDAVEKRWLVWLFTTHSTNAASTN